MRLITPFKVAMICALISFSQGNMASTDVIAPVWGETAAESFDGTAEVRAAYATRLAASSARATNPLDGLGWKCSLAPDNYRVAWKVREGISGQTQYDAIVAKVTGVAQRIRDQEMSTASFGAKVPLQGIPQMLKAMQRNDSIWLAVTWLPDLGVSSSVEFPKSLLQDFADLSPIELVYLQSLAYARLCDVNDENASLLKRILEQEGWPSRTKFGKEAEDAAWLISQHADSDIELQKRILTLLSDASEEGSADPKHYAYLWDRVAISEGRPQRYGTQFVPTACGGLELAPLEDESKVDALREASGMWPLSMYREMGERDCKTSDQKGPEVSDGSQ